MGGGVVGLAAAEAISRRDPNLEVAVLEAGRIGGGATGMSTGMIGPCVGGTLPALRRRWGDDVARRLFKESEVGVESAARVIAELGIDCGLQDTPQLYVSHTGAGRRSLVSRAQALCELGLPCELLLGKAVRNATGVATHSAGLRFPRALLVDPAALCGGLASALLERGVSVHDTSPVGGLARDRAGWTLRTPRGVLRARRVILATGAAGRLAGLSRQVAPLRVGALLTAPLPLGALRAWTGEPVVGTRNVFNYYRRTPDGRLLFGGGQPTVGPRSQSVERRLEAELRATFPELQRLPVEGRWSGDVGFTRDRLPIVGHASKRPGVFVAVGFCGHGLGLAFAAARWLAEVLSGGPGPDLPCLRGSSPRLPPQPLDRVFLRWAIRAALLADAMCESVGRSA